MTLSVVTVTFNSLSTLKEAYASLWQQSYSNWEWVVQDGGSVDGTVEWLESLSDVRIKWVSEPDNGIYDALNKAVHRASGEWIGLLHADDLYPHDKVLYEVAEATVGHDAIYGDLKYVHASDITKVLRYWQSGSFSPTLIQKGWMPPHPTLFLRKEIYTQVGLFDTEFKIAADYDFIIRVFQLTHLKVAYIPTVLMLMRQGGASSKLSNLSKKSREDLKILKKNKIPYYRIVLIRKIASKFKQFIFKS